MLTKAERARRHAHLTELLAHPASDTNRIESVIDQLTYHYGRAMALVGELGHVDGIPDDMPERGTRFMFGAVERAADAGELVGAATSHRHDDEVGRSGRSAPHRARPRPRPGSGRPPRLRRGPEPTSTRWRRSRRPSTTTGSRRGCGSCSATSSTRRTTFPVREPCSTTRSRQWRALDDSEGMADALRLRAQTEMFGGDLAGAESRRPRCPRPVPDVGNRRGEAWGLQTLAFVSFFGGAIDITEARLDEAGALFADLGDWGGLGWALGLLAWLRYTQGRFAEAERLGRQVADDIAGNRRRLGARDDGPPAREHRVVARDTRGRRSSSRAPPGSVFTDLPDAWGEIQAHRADRPR